MAKKQVSVSLRKPPSPDAVDAFVEGNEPKPEAPPKRSRRSSTRAERVSASEAQESVTPVPVSGVVEVAAREPVVESVSEPKPAVEAPAPQPVAEPPVMGPHGMPLRPVTIYLPQELAERLSMHCIEHDRDMSKVIGEALTNHLAPRLGAGAQAKASEPSEPSHARPSSFWSDAPPFPRIEWPPRKIEQIVEIGRLIFGMVRRRAYAT